MGFVSKISIAAGSVALAVFAVSAAAEPPEPLVVTRLADPDPNFVAPAERKHGRRHAAAENDTALDAAMADFGRVLGEALLAQQQLIDQRCKATEASAADRMAWEAACRYARH
jgi:hypothetical protein